MGNSDQANLTDEDSHGYNSGDSLAFVLPDQPRHNDPSQTSLQSDTEIVFESTEEQTWFLEDDDASSTEAYSPAQDVQTKNAHELSPKDVVPMEENEKALLRKDAEAPLIDPGTDGAPGYPHGSLPMETSDTK